MLILHQKYKIEGVNFMVSNRENGLCGELYGELAEGVVGGGLVLSQRPQAVTRNLGGGPMTTRS